MTTFAYQVRDQSGRRVKGSIEATSEKSAADQLAEQGYLITKLSTRARFDLLAPVGKISSDDLTMFYFQLSNLVEAGIPLLAALQTIANQLEGPKLKKIVQKLCIKIQNGASLSEAMRGESRVFSTLYRSMIEVGETSGHLAENLKYVAELNESKNQLHDQIVSSLAYPVVLMVASVAVVLFMIIWIIPTFTSIFTRAEIPLPLPTQIIYNLSLFFKAYPLPIVVAICAVAIGAKFLLRVPEVKFYWNRFCLGLPFIGPLIRRIEITRWSRAVALMLSSGVPILKTLEISGKLTRNRIFEDIYQDAYTAVQGGGKLADTLQKNNVFFNDAIQMIATGENSGTLDKMLYKVASFYDQLINRSLRRLTGVIEPFFIVFMGVIVGFIMLSILLPIFNMISVLGKV